MSEDPEDFYLVISLTCNNKFVHYSLRRAGSSAAGCMDCCLVIQNDFDGCIASQLNRSFEGFEGADNLRIIYPSAW